MGALKFKPGDRIVYKGWGGGSGFIVRCSPKTALVRLDHKGVDERYDLGDLRPETAADAAKRHWETALRAWRAARPQSCCTSVELRGSRLDEVCVHVIAESPQDMRTAADELRALADWFERRPRDVA